MGNKLRFSAAVITVACCLTLVGPTASWAGPGHPVGASGLCVTARSYLQPRHQVHVGDGLLAENLVKNCGPRGHHFASFKYVFLFKGPCGVGWHLHGHVSFKHSDAWGYAQTETATCVGTYFVITAAYYHGQLIAYAKRRVIVRH